MIYLSAELVRAGHGLTLAERRLVLLARTKVSAWKPGPSGGIGLVTTVHAEEYCETYQVSRSTAYRQLKLASKGLFDREISLFLPDHKRFGKPLTTVRLRWVRDISYREGEGRVDLEWHRSVIPHLTSLMEVIYLKYPLDLVSSLKSVASWRLFELISMFRGSGWAKFTVEDLKVTFDAPPSAKFDFAVFRRRYLDPARRDLNRRFGLKIKFRFEIIGRRYDSVIMNFTFPNIGWPVEARHPAPLDTE